MWRQQKALGYKLEEQVCQEETERQPVDDKYRMTLCNHQISSQIIHASSGLISCSPHHMQGCSSNDMQAKLCQEMQSLDGLVTFVVPWGVMSCACGVKKMPRMLMATTRAHTPVYHLWDTSAVMSRRHVLSGGKKNNVVFDIQFGHASSSSSADFPAALSPMADSTARLSRLYSTFLPYTCRPPLLLGCLHSWPAVVESLYIAIHLYYVWQACTTGIETMVHPCM